MASYQAICLESTLHILGFFGCQIWNHDLQLALHGSPLRPQLTMPRNSQLFNNNYYMSLGGVAWTDAVSSFKVSEESSVSIPVVNRVNLLVTPNR